MEVTCQYSYGCFCSLLCGAVEMDGGDTCEMVVRPFFTAGCVCVRQGFTMLMCCLSLYCAHHPTLYSLILSCTRHSPYVSMANGLSMHPTPLPLFLPDDTIGTYSLRFTYLDNI